MLPFVVVNGSNSIGLLLTYRHYSFRPNILNKSVNKNKNINIKIIKYASDHINQWRQMLDYKGTQNGAVNIIKLQ